MSVFNIHSKYLKLANNGFESSCLFNKYRRKFPNTLICCCTSSSSNSELISSSSKERSVGLSEIKEYNEKIDLNPPRGTRDFFPDDMRIQKWLYQQFTIISELFGFDQIDSPVLESEILYTRKAGEEITEQLYNFKDKGGRKVALRPELTPSLARMLLKKGKALAIPTKWYSIGQCWRYERMSRGRRREHYQWNMDIIGIEGLEAEAEILSAIVMLFENVGLTSDDVGIKISSRKVLQELLKKYNVKNELFGMTCVIVDKIDKLPKNEIESQLLNLGLDKDVINSIFEITTIKSLNDLKSILNEKSEAIQNLERLDILIKGYQIGKWIEYDFSIVRGLAYYTGIVFEGFDRSGKFRAICGGGRYDKLLSTFGGGDGENKPCIGFGFGDTVIMEILKDKNLIPEFKKKVDDFIFVVDESLRPEANGIAYRLRKKGRYVELSLEAKKIKWAFKRVEKIGAERMILIGLEEWRRGFVRIKDLNIKEEKEVLVSDL